MEKELNKEIVPNFIVPIKSFGNVAMSGTSRKVLGTGIRFGNPETKDGYGDYFDELTQTGMKNGSDRPFLFDHWEDPTFAFKVVGNAVFEKNKEGWDYEATLNDDEVGNLAFDKLSEPEVVHRSSTGSAWNYTKGMFTTDNAFLMTTWLVLEISATKQPADFWNPQIKVKSLADFKNLSAIIAPLLEEQKKHILGIETLEEKFKELNEQVGGLKLMKSLPESESRSIILSDDVQAEVAELLEFAKSIK